MVMLAKLLNRARRRLAKVLDARPTLPTRHSHRAYPEAQIADDGTWTVRFYSYEPLAWMYQGETYAESPADVPEPTLRHPTTYAEGLAPPENKIAWEKYYAERPQAVTLLEVITGTATSREAAAKDSHRAMRERVEHYRRAQL